MFAVNVNTAKGVINQLRLAKKGGKVKAVAFDAAPAEVQAIKEGLLQGAVSQNPRKIGELAVDNMQRYLDGKRRHPEGAAADAVRDRRAERRHARGQGGGVRRQLLMTEFAGKAALVTGAAGGIGRADRGAVGTRRRGRDPRSDARAGGRLRRHAGGESSSRASSRLDILVNCAGIQRYGTVEETSEELWDEVMAST